MKISQLRREGKQDVRVVVTAMMGSDLLMKNLQEKYLPDIARESFIEIRDLAKKLNVEIDLKHPQSMMENILSSLSAQHPHSSSHTIILLDEVSPMSKEEEEENADKADWSSLKSREGVDFIVALSTFSGNEALIKVTPPTDRSVLCKRLTTPHRNCAQVATLLKYQI